eukprot:scaffold1949_cov348-Pavlova_lutheri.AAC.25
MSRIRSGDSGDLRTKHAEEPRFRLVRKGGHCRSVRSSTDRTREWGWAREDPFQCPPLGGHLEGTPPPVRTDVPFVPIPRSGFDPLLTPTTPPFFGPRGGRGLRGQVGRPTSRHPSSEDDVALRNGKRDTSRDVQEGHRKRNGTGCSRTRDTSSGRRSTCRSLETSVYSHDRNGYGLRNETRGGRTTRVRSRGFQDRTHLRHVRSRGDRSVRSSTKSIGFDGTGVRFVHDGTSRRCVRDPVRGRRSCTVLSCREGSRHEPLRGSEIRLDSTTGLGSRWDPSPRVFGLDFFVRPGPSAPRLRGRFPTGDLRSPRGGCVPRSHPVGRISNERMGWEGWRERIRVG